MLAGSYTGLVLLENKDTESAPRWISTRKIKGFNLSVRYVEYDESDDIWWIFHGTGLSAIKLNSEYSKVVSCQHYPNQNNSYQTNLFKDKGRVYFTTDSGIYRYNSIRQEFELSEEWNQRIGNRDYLRVVSNEENSCVWYMQSGKLKINYITPHGYITDSISTTRLQNNLMGTFESINRVDSATCIISTLDGFSLYRITTDSLSSLSNSYKFLIKK